MLCTRCDPIGRSAKATTSVQDSQLPFDRRLCRNMSPFKAAYAGRSRADGVAGGQLIQPDLQGSFRGRFPIPAACLSRLSVSSVLALLSNSSPLTLAQSIPASHHVGHRQQSGTAPPHSHLSLLGRPQGRRIPTGSAIHRVRIEFLPPDQECLHD